MVILLLSSHLFSSRIHTDVASLSILELERDLYFRVFGKRTAKSAVLHTKLTQYGRTNRSRCLSYISTTDRLFSQSFQLARITLWREISL